MPSSPQDCPCAARLLRRCPEISCAQHPAPKKTQAGHSGRASAVYPIESLSAYQICWTIKARVTNKSDIRTSRNDSHGEGKLLNVTLMDDNGEIMATGFNALVHNFYNRLQEGKVYLVSNARRSVWNYEYELTLERET